MLREARTDLESGRRSDSSIKWAVRRLVNPLYKTDGNKFGNQANDEKQLFRQSKAEVHLQLRVGL